MELGEHSGTLDQKRDGGLEIPFLFLTHNKVGHGYQLNSERETEEKYMAQVGGNSWVILGDA